MSKNTVCAPYCEPMQGGADVKKLGNIIDQTLMNIGSVCQGDHDLWQLAAMLNQAGADIFEIDQDVVQQLSRHQADCKVKLAYRLAFDLSEDAVGTRKSVNTLIDAVEKLPSEIRKSIAYLILPIQLATSQSWGIWSNWCSEQKIRTIIEVDLENFTQRNVQQIADSLIRTSVDVLRIKGLEVNGLPFEFDAWQRIKDEVGVVVDICAGNSRYMATALAVEAMKNGAEYVTTSFAGGMKNNAAAFEEVIMAKNILLNLGIAKENCAVLGQISEWYQQVTGSEVHPMKPIIGSGIFHYESGIHAAGMKKNHRMYEPYPPEMVGKQRELFLGKHTGSHALQMKLSQLNIQVSPDRFSDLLENLHRLSVVSKRGLYDREVLELVRGTVYGANCRYDIT